MTGELAASRFPRPPPLSAEERGSVLPSLFLDSSGPCQRASSTSRKMSGDPLSFEVSISSDRGAHRSSSHLCAMPSTSSLKGGGEASMSHGSPRVTLPALSSSSRSSSHSGSFEDRRASGEGKAIVEDTSEQQQQLSNSSAHGSSLQGFINSTGKQHDMNCTKGSGSNSAQLSSSSFVDNNNSHNTTSSTVNSPRAGFDSLASFFFNSNSTSERPRENTNTYCTASSPCSSSSRSSSSSVTMSDGNPPSQRRNSGAKDDFMSFGVENSFPRWGRLAPLPSSPRAFFSSRNLCSGGGGPLQNSFRRSFILQVSGKPFRTSEKAEGHTCSVSFSSVFPDVALEAGEVGTLTSGEETTAGTSLATHHPPSHGVEPTESILLPSKRDVKTCTGSSPPLTTTTTLFFGAKESTIEQNNVKENPAAVQKPKSSPSSLADDDIVIDLSSRNAIEDGDGMF